jgi:hypothetical protein
MTTIAQLAATLRELFSSVADRLAVETQFVRRKSKLTGAAFARAVVMGWLANPQATDAQLAQSAAAVGVPITAQGLTARFTWPAAELMRCLLEAAVGHVVAACPAAAALLARFDGVYIQDSTTITLPDVLNDIWPGSGASGSHPTAAGLKVQLQWDYHTGQLSQLVLQPGAAQDRDAPIQTTRLPPGALRLADLGYFSLPVLAELSGAGVYWLSRLQANTQLWMPDGQCCEQGTLLRGQAAPAWELPVLLGKQQRLPCRLLVMAVPPEVAASRRRALRREARRKGQTVSHTRLLLADWTILVTNVPAALLSIAEAQVLLGCRWQVELMFRLWKSQGQVDESRSPQPWRVLTEVYAKLLAMVVQHWLFLVGHWSFLDRSLVKASQTVRQHAMHLAVHLDTVEQLAETIGIIARCLQAGCRINKSRTTPRTYQRLKAVEAHPDDLSMLSPTNVPHATFSAIP